MNEESGKKFVTRDGVEIEVGREYFRQNGEVVTVHGIVERTGYVIVTGYFGGSTMGCKLYPSGHTEIELDYEHESEEFTLFCNQLYAEEPVFVITPRIKEKQEELAVIATKIGLAKVELRHSEKMLRDQKISMEKELEDMQNATALAEKKAAEIVENLKAINKGW